MHEMVYQTQGGFNDATAVGYVSDWNITTGILKLRNVKGSFNGNSPLIGRNSGASFNFLSANLQDNANDPQQENVLIENEALNILDFSEHNPFGEP